MPDDDCDCGDCDCDCGDCNCDCCDVDLSGPCFDNICSSLCMSSFCNGEVQIDQENINFR
ncbi:hypothetical protein JAAARDRAFT_36153 [Jaapia argillacea MUCL 33604]|uniref:Uncharacterized protein n=1 Tax=Jaapia argillacea MUCL 33604 TaxID=933084 RepID=A0A067PPD5_9AGAM|nr:hypothetical protein JAAARDRAFT_36153 [Jaapia argillacea MUCL 33604]